MEITADSKLSQQEIYDLAKEKASKGRLKWEDPTFGIVEINIDDTIDVDVKTKVALISATDHLTNQIKES
jgi:hypothetical protein